MLCRYELQAPVQLYHSTSGLSFVVDDAEDAGSLSDGCWLVNDAASRSATSLQ